MPPRSAAFLVVTLFCFTVEAQPPAGLTQAAPTAVTAKLAAAPHPAMLRYPDVSSTHVVFVYANDLWLVPREGGLALPLASPLGLETFPRFSPDETRIAFVGNYEGDRDLYVIPVEGGVPTRVTHHPASETLCDWTPEGNLLFYSNAFAGLGRQAQLLTVPPTGGLPEKLPPPYGANGAISPDGEWLVYTPHTRDHRTWKRYRGGMATDIWLFNLRDHSARTITDWEGTDSQPMWHGRTVYYLSDAGPAHRLNIWSYDIDTGRRRQITRFEDFDVKWPSMGPGDRGQGEIVFQNGADLYLLDLGTGESRSIEVTVPGDKPTIKPRTIDASKFIHGWDISPTGKRALLEARGDVWTVPAKHGSPRDLTRTDGVADRDPAWSPDGKWVAYLSDATGEYELYVTQSDGRGETRRLTRDGEVFRYSPTWSPDAKKIVFTDKTGAIYLHTIDTGETTLVDVEPWAGRSRVSWAPDSRWIVYTKTGDNRLSSIWLYAVETGQKHQLTAGMFGDSWPVFDREGKYLFFASNRDFSSPQYEDVGTTFIYADTDVLVLVPLRDDVASPWLPESDEESWEGRKDGEDEEKDEKDEEGDQPEDDDAEDGDEEEPDDASESSDTKENGNEAEEKDEEKEEDGKKEKKKEVEPIDITIEGFERRAIQIPVKRGRFVNLAVSHDGKLIYARVPARGEDEKPAIHIFDLKDEKEKEKTVLEGVAGFQMSADGKKLLVRKGDRFAIVNPAPKQKLEDLVSLDGMTVRIDPRDEWRQIFHEAWRIHRDFFYDPNMHGVDWPAMRDHYEKMLDDCVSRRDVTYVIGEMISELNVGHAYIRGQGDVEDEPRVNCGMLGAAFALDNGAYRITKIYEGGPWDLDAKGPLSQPGLDIKEGDYLLGVSGVPLDTAKDPWAAFQGLAGKEVTLTVSDKPTIDDDARYVVVEPARGDGDLRYRDWVEANRQYVEEKTDGRVGYIHVPNTGVQGQNELVRQYFGQIHKGALIIDERWNGGGQIPTRFIELLNRPITNYWARRDGHDWPWPPDAHQGPKCMLINGLAGSGGDAFPAYFRMAGLGKLIGMRTWGGLVGISGNPRFIDGGYTSAPTFAYYEKDGTWGIEGHGVDPDIRVVDDPSLMVDGGDPQLDAAIEHMLEELEHNPYVPPERPPYPDRSGMGIPEEER